MKQEYKELLFKDLCSRLPYEVKVTTNNFHNLTLLSINLNGIADVTPNNGYPMEINWEDCKPYLFPLSSMTKEQRKEYTSLLNHIMTIEGDVCDVCTVESINWLLENHFDVNNLIPLGLAKDATGLNIY